VILFFLFSSVLSQGSSARDRTQKKVRASVCDNTDSKLEYNQEPKHHPQAIPYNAFIYFR